MKKVLTIMLILLFFGVSAYGWEIAIGPSYQELNLSGKVQSEGTELDLEDDLGIDDDEATGLNVRLDGGRHHLCFDFASVEFSGAKTLSRAIQFRNKTYNISTYVESKIEYDLYEFQYHYDLYQLKEADFGFCLSPLFKLSIYDASISLKGGGNDEAYSEALPLPSLGLIGQLDCTKYLSLLTQVNGIGYSGDTYIEYKTILRIKPIDYFNLDIGYKGMKVDYSDSDDILDLDIDGFFLQGSFVYKF